MSTFFLFHCFVFKDKEITSTSGEMQFQKHSLVSVKSAKESTPSEVMDIEYWFIYSETYPRCHSKLQGKKQINRENHSSMKKLGGKIARKA